jgi:peroxiredoxin (alkyl hydroperoxide reductase subunit C)
MGEGCCGLRVGEMVPDFRVETYEPLKRDFGELTFERIKKEKKWLILFFYPADFTFV